MMTPNMIIDLSQLCYSSEICQPMTGISSYVYRFMHRNSDCIKVGMSAACMERDGDRIYRQAGHLAGWPGRLKGSSGSDMRKISLLWEQQHKIPLNKQDVMIEVYDLTSTPDLCEKIERNMIDQYLKKHGRLPVGNIDRLSLLSERRVKNRHQLSHLLDWSE